MKHILLSLLILLFSSTAFAWWTADAFVRVERTTVTSIVKNTTARPMYCWGYVYGETNYGARLQNFSQGWVAPHGGYGYIFVHSDSSDPFVRGWAQVNCSWDR